MYIKYNIFYYSDFECQQMLSDINHVYITIFINYHFFVEAKDSSNFNGVSSARTEWSRTLMFLMKTMVFLPNFCIQISKMGKICIAFISQKNGLISDC